MLSINKIARSLYITFFGTTILFSFFFIIPAFAKPTFQDAGGNLGIVANKTGYEKTTVNEFIPKIIATGFATVGSIFLALMVYAGMKWMTARGNSDAISTAQGTLVNATIGIILIIAAYTITSFITSRLIAGKTAGSDPGFEDGYGDESIGCCLWEQKSAWGSGMMTNMQCQDWKAANPTVVKQVIWDKNMDTNECKITMDEKNSLLNKITPDINLGP